MYSQYVAFYYFQMRWSCCEILKRVREYFCRYCTQNTKRRRQQRPLVLLCLSSINLLTVDPHVLCLVVPWTIQEALGKLQRSFRGRIRARMEQKNTLERLLKRTFREEYLQDSKATTYLRTAGINRLRGGEHIAVFEGKGSVYHHGIFMGYDEQMKDLKVLDNSNTRGADGKSIQARTLDHFLGESPYFDIIASSSNTNINKYRKTTMKIAEMLRALEYPTLQTYDLLSWNYETFALVCSTRSLYAQSEQVIKIFNLCEEDLRRGYDSLILQMGSAVSSSSWGSCGIM